MVTVACTDCGFETYPPAQAEGRDYWQDVENPCSRCGNKRFNPE